MSEAGLPDTEPAPANSDLMLVERAVAGDQRAFELLVIKYQRRIERLIARMVRDVDLVEDIAQETFIRAWRALHQFRGCLLYTSPSPRDRTRSRMPSSA